MVLDVAVEARPGAFRQGGMRLGGSGEARIGLAWRRGLYKEFQMEDDKLRDEFAKAAITGILAGRWGNLPHRKPEEAFAEFAWLIANEMLKRRSQWTSND